MPALLNLLTPPERRIEWVLLLYPVRLSDSVVLTLGASTWPGRADITGLNETPVALLTELGQLSEDLGGDVDFSGPASVTVGGATLSNPARVSGGVGDLDGWRVYAYSGRKAEIWVLEEGAAWSTAILRQTFVISGEIELAGNDARIAFESSLNRLARELDVSKHVGIPVCVEGLTTTSKATAPSDAAYDTLSFTVSARFRQPTIGAGNSVLMRRELSGTNRQFVVRLLGTTGVIEVRSSFGGTNTLVHASTARYDDSAWHHVVYALFDATTAYVMVDDELLATITPAASVDLPAAGLEMVIGVNLREMDVRFYRSYFDPDEARSLLSSRGDAEDDALVGLFHYDEGLGGTGTDYSATGNNATLAGVLNTDYAWRASDQGVEALAGQQMPLVFGHAVHVPAQLIHVPATGGPRYRYNEDAGLIGVGTVYARGAPLTLTTDYTLPGEGVIAFVAGQSDPITFSTSEAPATIRTPDIAAAMLESHAGFITGTDLNPQSFENLAALMPFAGSLVVGSGMTAEQALRDLLPGCFIREDRSGQLAPGLLLPPSSPGPNGDVYCLEHAKGGGLSYGDLADVTGSFTVCAWVKPWRLDRSADDFSDEYLVSKLTATNGYWLKLPADKSGVVAFGFRLSSTDYVAESAENVALWGQWNFLAGVFDSSLNRLTLYRGIEGGSAVVVATKKDVTVDPIGTSAALTLALSLHGAQGVTSVWSAALSSVQVQGVMDTAPVAGAANLLFCALLNEGSGNPADLVSTTTATFDDDASLWQPVAIWNESQTPSMRATRRRLVPARRIDLTYRPNDSPLAAGDVAGAVSTSDRWERMRPYRQVTFNQRNARALHLGARELSVATRISNGRAARALLRLLARRFGFGREIVGVTGAGRRGLALEPGRSEALILSPRHGLESGVHVRVTQVSAEFMRLDSDFTGWR